MLKLGPRMRKDQLSSASMSVWFPRVWRAFAPWRGGLGLPVMGCTNGQMNALSGKTGSDATVLAELHKRQTVASQSGCIFHHFLWDGIVNLW